MRRTVRGACHFGGQSTESTREKNLPKLGFFPRNLHPWRLTWNITMEFGSDHFPFLSWVICRFQPFIFQGVTNWYPKNGPYVSFKPEGPPPGFQSPPIMRHLYRIQPFLENSRGFEFFSKVFLQGPRMKVQTFPIPSIYATYLPTFGWFFMVFI